MQSCLAALHTIGLLDIHNIPAASGSTAARCRWTWPTTAAACSTHLAAAAAAAAAAQAVVAHKKTVQLMSKRPVTSSCLQGFKDWNSTAGSLSCHRNTTHANPQSPTLLAPRETTSTCTQLCCLFVCCGLVKIAAKFLGQSFTWWPRWSPLFVVFNPNIYGLLLVRSGLQCYADSMLLMVSSWLTWEDGDACRCLAVRPQQCLHLDPGSNQEHQGR
jgi:hypothetical protein